MPRPRLATKIWHLSVAFRYGIFFFFYHLHMTSSKWQQQPKICAKQTNAPAECKSQQKAKPEQKSCCSHRLSNDLQLCANSFASRSPLGPPFSPRPSAIISWQPPSVCQPRTKLDPRSAEILTRRCRCRWRRSRRPRTSEHGLESTVCGLKTPDCQAVANCPAVDTKATTRKWKSQEELPRQLE